MKKHLIFIPAWGPKSLDYSEFINELSHKYIINVIPLPIHSSEHLRRVEYKIEPLDYFTKYLRNKINLLNLKRYIVIGHSYGGAIAIKLLEKDKSIQKVVAIDPALISSKIFYFQLLINKYIPFIVKKALAMRLHQVKDAHSISKLAHIYKDSIRKLKYYNILGEEQRRLIIIAGKDKYNVHPYANVVKFHKLNPEIKIITHKGDTNSLFKRSQYFASLVKDIVK